MKKAFENLLCLLCACAALPQFSACAHKPDVEGVQRANDQFYAALNIMFTGDSAPIESVWSHSDSTSYMGPSGGMLLGWNQILAEWNSQASKKLGGKVQPSDEHITVGENLAVVIDREVGENIGPNGEPLKVSIRATNVYRKEGGVWKMIGHHTDLLDFLAK